eukprot:TRINITY_DN5336_c0_g1_i1.p1 TRINITY_DN5336_c0_g1~~TRINITY_DN5336_c0_g1_i1.p1  ORF type:complete len:288 (+),score=62.92 TRINITY_DN5336_c0_g1_i1:15-878(+)
MSSKKLDFSFNKTNREYIEEALDDILDEDEHRNQNYDFVYLEKNDSEQYGIYYKFEKRKIDEKAIKRMISQGGSPDYLARVLMIDKKANEKLIKLLLESRADPNYKNPTTKKTTMQIAFEDFDKYFKILQLFMEHGGDLAKMRFVMEFDQYSVEKCLRETMMGNKKAKFFCLANHFDYLSFFDEDNYSSSNKNFVDDLEDIQCYIKNGGSVWSLQDHHLFPLRFQRAVFTFVTCLNVSTQKKKLFNKIPKPIIQIILRYYDQRSKLYVTSLENSLSLYLKIINSRNL